MSKVLALQEQMSMLSEFQANLDIMWVAGYWTIKQDPILKKSLK